MSSSGCIVQPSVTPIVSLADIDAPAVEEWKIIMGILFVFQFMAVPLG